MDQDAIPTCDDDEDVGTQKHLHDRAVGLGPAQQQRVHLAEGRLHTQG